MPNAQRILEHKGSAVITIGPDATVVEATQLMNEHHIGSLVVVTENRLVGIFTERDVMRRVVADRREPETTKIRDVMTTPVACATPTTTYSELCAVMREKRIRHLPVVDDSKVVGMISIGDLNRTESDVQEQTILYLKQYMSVS